MIVIRDYQHVAISDTREALRKYKNVLLYLPTGGGKCLAPGTPVLKFDGSIAAVEKIVTGDLLMGSDNKPRKVLSTTSGTDEMYKIIPVKGESFICNSDHVLSLVNNAHNNRFQYDEIINIPVNEYLNLPKSVKHCLKLWRTGVDFPAQQRTIDPYLIGLWLADGTKACSTFTLTVNSKDTEIFNYLSSLADENYYVPICNDNDRGTCKRVGISGGSNGGKANKYLNEIRRCLAPDSQICIPQDYLVDSRENRLQLLAGLLDGDGYLHHGGFEITTKYTCLRDGILFLARSLGFSANYSIKHVKLDYGFEGDYQRISISGDTHLIPTRLPRKQASVRQQLKSVLRTGFKVEPVGKGQYYGFEIEGDGLFLLGDFTVTHNTTVASVMIHGAVSKDWPVVFIAHRRELITQAYDRLALFGIASGKIMGKHKYQGAKVNVASVQTLINGPMPPAKLVFIDEAHRFVLEGGVMKEIDEETGETTETKKASMYKKVYDYYTSIGAFIVGLTATPRRLDNKSLGAAFEYLVMPKLNGEFVNPLWLIKNGYLVLPRYFTSPIKADFSQLKKSGADYNQEDVFNAMNRRELYRGAVEEYQRRATGKKFIVFCSNVKASKILRDEFRAAGIMCEHVDSDTNEIDRDNILKSFKSGTFTGLLNVGLFTEGYDLPAIETIILYRKTASETLYLQMGGRVLRPVYAKGYDTETIEGRLLAIANGPKPRCIVIDLGENIKYHGYLTDERNYNLENNPKKKGVAPIKECENIVSDGLPCGALVSLTVRICPECGYEFPVMLAMESKQKTAELIEVLPDYLQGRTKDGFHHDLSIERLEEFRKSQKFSIDWLVQQLLDRADNDIHLFAQFLREYARMTNKARGWIATELGKADAIFQM